MMSIYFVNESTNFFLFKFILAFENRKCVNKKIHCLGFLNFLGEELNVDYVINQKFKIFQETVFFR